MVEDYIIIGTGRHAAETFYLLEDLGRSGMVVGFASDGPLEEKEFLGKCILTIQQMIELYKDQPVKPSVLVAIGSSSIKKKIVAQLDLFAFPYFNAIHSDINVARQKFIGKGVTINAGAILTCNISINDHSIVNIGATISHDCSIGKYVNISPGSHLAGNVTIDDEVFIGVGASVIPKIHIGKGSIIAAGACVIKNVPASTMVAGNPAVIKKTGLLP